MLLGLVVLCVGRVGATAAGPFISWVGPAQVAPGQTAMVSGSGFSPGCTVALTSSGNETIVVPPASVTAEGVMVTVPSSFQLDVYTVQVRCPSAHLQKAQGKRVTSGGVMSNKVMVNAPRLWWAQGNCGNESTGGGTLRLFGAALALAPASSFPRVIGSRPDSISNASFTVLQRLQKTAEEALRHGNYDKAADLARQLATLTAAPNHHHPNSRSQGGQRDRPAARMTRVRLTPVGGGDPTVLTADPATLTEHHASVALPPTLAPGEYLVAASNGLGDGPIWVALEYFESPERPLVRTVVVRPGLPSGPPDPRAFPNADAVCRAVPPTVVSMTEFGPTGPMPISQRRVDATAGLARALEAAAANGGGTVFFPRGQYWVSGSFSIPDNVYLKGEGETLVSLYWQEANTSRFTEQLFTGATPAHPNGTVTWGLSDLTIYVTAYYKTLLADGPVSCNNVAPPWGCTSSAVGFAMRRVRIRANAYFASGGPCSTGERPRPGVHFNFSQSQVQGLVTLTGKNWAVTDCDLLGTGEIFWSGGSGGGYGGTAWGLLGRNTVRNGGNSLAMDQWKQVIVEDNVITGISLAAMGNNIATYNGGYAQHVAVLNNSISHVWGDDREVLTYDNAGGAYFGPLSGVSEAHVTTASDRIPLNRSGTTNSGTGGGWVVVGGALLVLNGSGAGLIRRIVANDSPRGWTLDKPLEQVTLANSADPPSFVQLLPFRGRNILHRNRFSDCGAVQFYGIGLENLVTANVNQRMAGMVAWGQWREWTPPPPRPGPGTHPDPSPARIGGEMGCGANPNWRNVFDRNVFLESNTVVNYNTAQGSNANFLGGYQLASTSGGGAAGAAKGAAVPGIAMNQWVVFRGNEMQSNGGILITDDSTHVLVEANVVTCTSLNITVANTTTDVVLRGNTVVPGCGAR